MVNGATVPKAVWLIGDLVYGVSGHKRKLPMMPLHSPAPASHAVHCRRRIPDRVHAQRRTPPPLPASPPISKTPMNQRTANCSWPLQRARGLPNLGLLLTSRHFKDLPLFGKANPLSALPKFVVISQKMSNSRESASTDASVTNDDERRVSRELGREQFRGASKLDRLHKPFIFFDFLRRKLAAK